MKKIWITQIYNNGSTISYETEFKTLYEANNWIRNYGNVADFAPFCRFEAFEKEGE